MDTLKVRTPNQHVKPHLVFQEMICVRVNGQCEDDSYQSFSEAVNPDTGAADFIQVGDNITNRKRTDVNTESRQIPAVTAAVKARAGLFVFTPSSWEIEAE
ncbi:uncharacterized protein V6R79_009009 [Siganus canaliculatus]